MKAPPPGTSLCVIRGPECVEKNDRCVSIFESFLNTGASRIIGSLPSSAFPGNEPFVLLPLRTDKVQFEQMICCEGCHRDSSCPEMESMAEVPYCSLLCWGLVILWKCIYIFLEDLKCATPMLEGIIINAVSDDDSDKTAIVVMITMTLKWKENIEVLESDRSVFEFQLHH